MVGNTLLCYLLNAVFSFTIISKGVYIKFKIILINVRQKLVVTKDDEMKGNTKTE